VTFDQFEDIIFVFAEKLNWFKTSLSSATLDYDYHRKQDLFKHRLNYDSSFAANSSTTH